MNPANLEFSRPEQTKYTFDVVIAGGGFAGIYAAKALAAKLGSSACTRVAIVAEQNFMLFQPMLAEVAGSSLSPTHVVNPIRALCKNVTVIRGSIASVDLDARRLEVKTGDFSGSVAVNFEHLSLAIGGVVDLSRVPGMAEHAFLLKNVGDALRLRMAIIDRFEEAAVTPDPAERRRLLTYVVVGGGYSGVEVAGQIIDVCREIVRYYPSVPTDSFRVVLAHSGKQLLPEISGSLGRYCEENLRSRGVEIMLGVRASAMTSGKIFFGDHIVLAHTVVTTVGNAPNPVLLKLIKDYSLPSEKGRVLTDSTFRVEGRDRLWAAGDCAAVPMPKTKPLSPTAQRQFCPPTAQFAMRQGKLMGENIAAALENRGRGRPFKFSGLGELAAIGHRAAVAEIMGLKFSGFIAWIMWRTIYLSKLPGLERKIRVMIEWTLDLFFPRDISLLESRPTQVIKESFCTAGDMLCHAGEPAFFFYIVKSGRIELFNADNTPSRSVLPGDHFGERALLNDQIWHVTAIAAEDSTVVAIGASAFESVLGADASIREFLLKTASNAAMDPEKTAQELAIR
ncbi:MAG TPA: FAD-dependent oxidoreductase [Chthoniobacterales bacterium]